MKTLIIVRHAAYDHSDPLIADVDRPLNRQGIHQADEMARRFAALEVKPDLLVSSIAKRAVETAKVYAKRLNIPPESIQLEEDIFEAERVEILRVVQALDDAAETVVLFGHHPGVTRLLHHLADSEIEQMPMGAFAVLELSAERWHAVSFKKGRLLHQSEPQEKKIRRGLWWQFIFWRRQHVQKVELFFVFAVGLLLILAVVALIFSSSTDSAGVPQQGSMGQRNYDHTETE